jgi:TonB family protein
VSAKALSFDLSAHELEESRNRTGWTMSASLVIHGALLLWLIFLKPAAGAVEPLTEITLLGPADLQPEPAPAGAAAPASPGPTEPGVRVAQAVDDHFRRAATPADFSPDPQSNLASADRLSARLATLRQDASLPAVGGGTENAPMSLWSAPAGAPSATGGGGNGHALERGSGVGHGPVLALGRGGGSGPVTAIGSDAVPAGLVEKAAAAPEADTHARRTIAGASLAGPIADRPIVHVVTPVYPDWAKRDGVEATVTLYFVVRPDGSVKENVLIQKTAGFAEFDDNARTALAAWRFEPLHGGRTGEQWGTITFHYRLRDA